MRGGGWQNHVTLQLIPVPQTILILGGDHGWRTPSSCPGVVEGKTTWPPVITLPSPQLYWPILGHRFFLHKSSGITPFPHLGGFVAVMNEICVLSSCAESLSAASSGPHATSVMAPHGSDVLTVHVCLFLVGKECYPFISVRPSWAQGTADIKIFNKWLYFIALN